MKPGIKTTEFWLSLATTLWGAFGHMLPPVAQAIVVAVVPSAYAIARAITKGALPASPQVNTVTVGNP